jgi:predicted Zn-dependent protease
MLVGTGLFSDPAFHAFLPNTSTMDAKSLVVSAFNRNGHGTPLVILTRRKLLIDGRVSVFGYSDRKHQVAVVSSFHLDDGSPHDQIAQRVLKVILHEIGHLRGFGHCSGVCAMRSASSVAELDRRPLSRCGNCIGTRVKSAARLASAAMVVLISLGVFNRGLSYFEEGEQAYTCWAVDGCGHASARADGSDDRVSIYFRGRKLVTLRDLGHCANLRDRSVPAVLALNRSFGGRTREQFVVGRGSHGPTIDSASTPQLLEVLPLDVPEGETAEALAAQWATALNSTR